MTFAPSSEQPIEHIPTNILTGFLGVGKTTAILHLLQHKPVNERWAVLVNEFGEVGIDGALIAGHYGEEQGVFIREVPGGCMCCAAGLPMQMALNMLLARARPDRLLIEPTGLGHPKEVLQTLQAAHYQTVLDLQTTLTLVDARNLADARYTDHETFNQQLQIADLIVAHKVDLYSGDELQQLRAYLDDNPATQQLPMVAASQGQIDPQRLHQPSRHNYNHSADAAAKSKPQAAQASLLPLSVPMFPATGFISAQNKGEGFYSNGWVFKPGFCFDKRKIDTLFSGLAAERIKAVLQTGEGVVGYNFSGGVLSETPLSAANDNRVEMISLQPLDREQVEQALLAAVVQSA